MRSINFWALLSAPTAFAKGLIQSWNMNTSSPGLRLKPKNEYTQYDNHGAAQLPPYFPAFQNLSTANSTVILFQSDLYHRIQLCAMRSWAQVAPAASSNATMTTRTTTAMRRATIHCWRRRLHSGDDTFKYKDNYDMPGRLPLDFSTPYWFYSSSSEAPRASRASRGGARVADRLVANFTWIFGEKSLKSWYLAMNEEKINLI